MNEYIELFIMIYWLNTCIEWEYNIIIDREDQLVSNLMTILTKLCILRVDWRGVNGYWNVVY